MEATDHLGGSKLSGSALDQGILWRQNWLNLTSGGTKIRGGTSILEVSAAFGINPDLSLD